MHCNFGVEEDYLRTYLYPVRHQGYVYSDSTRNRYPYINAGGVGYGDQLRGYLWTFKDRRAHVEGDAWV